MEIVKKKYEIWGSHFVVSIKIMILWSMRPYSLKTEEQWLVPMYQTTWCHIPLLINPEDYIVKRNVSSAQFRYVVNTNEFFWDYSSKVNLSP
jgi:hypothetical protein